MGGRLCLTDGGMYRKWWLLAENNIIAVVYLFSRAVEEAEEGVRNQKLALGDIMQQLKVS